MHTLQNRNQDEPKHRRNENQPKNADRKGGCPSGNDGGLVRNENLGKRDDSLPRSDSQRLAWLPP
jgi:hypothetical protein